MYRVFVDSRRAIGTCLFALVSPSFPFPSLSPVSFSFSSPSLPLPPYIPPLVLPALLLRVPSFPREPLRCPPILAWIRTGGPGTSMVSMPKSWLWAIAVSLSCISFLQTIVSYDLSPPTKVWARPASYNDTLKTNTTPRTPHPLPVLFLSQRKLP